MLCSNNKNTLFNCSATKALRHQVTLRLKNLRAASCLCALVALHSFATKSLRHQVTQSIKKIRAASCHGVPVCPTGSFMALKSYTTKIIGQQLAQRFIIFHVLVFLALSPYICYGGIDNATHALLPANVNSYQQPLLWIFDSKMDFVLKDKVTAALSSPVGRAELQKVGFSKAKLLFPDDDLMTTSNYVNRIIENINNEAVFSKIIKAQ